MPKPDKLANTAPNNASAEHLDSHEVGYLSPAAAEALGKTAVSVAANEADQSDHERLQSPLEADELATTIDIALEQAQRRIEDYEGKDRQTIENMRGDTVALFRINQLARTGTDVYVRDVVSPEEDLSISEKLGRVVQKYSQLTEKSEYLNSMGGTVAIPEDGIISNEGYNGAILYQFTRAHQIAKKLEGSPNEVRQTILEADEPNAEWLYSDPVTARAS